MTESEKRKGAPALALK